MKTKNMSARITLTFFLSAGLVVGACTTTQISTELPANHPANPAAEASVFVPPRNPFGMNAIDAQPVRPPDSSDNHTKHLDYPKHQEADGHGHQIRPLKPQGAAPDSSSERATQHQH